MCLCGRQRRTGEARRSVDILLLHPLEVLLVDVGPLEAELGAPIAGLDAAEAAGLCGPRARRLLGATAGAVPPAGALGEQLALVLAGAHAARGHLLAGHESQQAREDGADLPRRVEALGVEVGDAEAQPRAGLEAARGRVHADRRRREGVVRREHQRAPVLAAFVGGLRGTCDDVVPLEDVLL